MLISQERLMNMLLKEDKKLIKFAKVAPDHTSGKPQLIFDGESVATVKAYQYLADYTPTANDDVMLIADVIVGKIVR